jgi:hypothetical protein
MSLFKLRRPAKNWNGAVQIVLWKRRGVNTVLHVTLRKPLGFAVQQRRGRVPIRTVGWLAASPFHILRQDHK